MPKTVAPPGRPHRLHPTPVSHRFPAFDPAWPADPAGRSAPARGPTGQAQQPSVATAIASLANASCCFGQKGRPL
jgi:hypothetical protein